MPKIQEYLPETEAQGPVGRTEPLLEQVGMYGRGISDFGRGVTDAVSVINQRQTQQETSEAFAWAADTRAEYADRINQATRDGSINDPNSPNHIDKIKQDYQDAVEKQYDSYSTAGGKNAFTRASARTGGVILTHAASGAAVAAGEKAKNDFNDIVTKDSNTVMDDPSQFENLREGHRDLIQSQVANGAFSQQQADQIQKGSDLEMSKAMYRGLMKQDGTAITQAVVNNKGKVDFNAPQFNTAKGMLDSNYSNQFMNSDQKEEMYREIKANQTTAQTAGLLQINVREEAQRAAGKAFDIKFYDDAEKNRADINSVDAQVRAGNITPEHGYSLKNLALAQSKKELSSSPAAANDIYLRTLTPANDPNHIADQSQVMDRVTADKNAIGPYSPYVGAADFNKINSYMMNSGSDKDKANELQLLSAAKENIYAGAPANDQAAAHRFNNFIDDVQDAKQDAKANGKPISEAFNADSPYYAGKKLGNYVLSPQQFVKQAADQARGAIPAAPADPQIKPGFVPTPVTSFSVNQYKKDVFGNDYIGMNAEKVAEPNWIGGMSLQQLKSIDPSNLSYPDRQILRDAYNRATKAKK